ncbi:MAG TPA: NAD(P)H-hydrate dehydratase [Nitrolancea sp.]|nr:NAD(P)H-hydrate dehydratase [Nitrolancea sp.]
MRALCSVAQVRAAERAAIAGGAPEPELMLRAGSGVAELLAAVAHSPGRALILVGPGNNGGDGLVAAARLAQLGWHCVIWSFRRPGVAGAPVDPAVVARFRWFNAIEELRAAVTQADLVLDAVFGIGGRPGLPDAVVAAFTVVQEERRRRGVPLWALDIPSGVDADTGAVAEGALIADATVMVGLAKLGLYRAPALRHAGRLWLVEIGLGEPDDAAVNPEVVTPADAARLLPRRPRDAHKHGVGSLLVVGGAPNYYGAPRMAAEAALRAGAGLVALAVPNSLIAPIATGLPETTFVPLPEDDAAVRADAVRGVMARYSALLIGPGLGRADATSEFLARLFGFGNGAPADTAPFSSRAVIDADGLNWLAGRPEWPERLAGARLVLTPHPGEMARLSGRPLAEIEADPWRAAREAAERFGQVVVLKLAHAVVAAPGRRLVLAPQSEPALASAGTGDVLAGTIAGLLAQGLDPWEAAVTGVMLGSAAAERAVARTGTLGLIAGDVIAELAPATRRLYDPHWRRMGEEDTWPSTWTWNGS